MLQDLTRIIMEQQLTLYGVSRDRRTLWIVCLYCGRGDGRNPYELARRIGRNATLAEVGERLRCQRCGRWRGLALVDPFRRAGER